MKNNNILFLSLLIAMLVFFTNCKDDSNSTSGADPIITSIDNDEYYWGDLVIITGRNFTATEGQVIFSNGLSADVILWQDNLIKVTMPDGAETGSLYVLRADNLQSNKIAYWIKTNDDYEMVLIKGGTFVMGDNESTDMFDNNKPEHTVTISYDFYIAVTEVTQRQYKETVMKNPFQIQDDNRAANYITFRDAIMFCNALSKRKGLDTCYIINGNTIVCDFNANGYRLPTEAEWEYAARYKSASNNKFGFTGDPKLFAWYSDNNDNILQPRKVRQLQPNSAGLYDMNGNVAEWCWNYYSSIYYQECAGGVTDPTGPATGGGSRVLRGGSFQNGLENIKATARSSTNENDKDIKIGFRFVRKRK